MLLDLPHHLGTAMCSNGCGLDCPIALDEAKDDDFAGCAPTTFALSMPAKGGFVAFNGTSKGFTELLFVSTTGTDQAVKSLLGRTAGIVTKALTIDRNAKGKKLNEATLGRFRKTA